MANDKNAPLPQRAAREAKESILNSAPVELNL